MIGYDDNALNYMLDKFKADEVNIDIKTAKKVFNLALTYDIDYMVDSKIIVDGEFTDTYYDEDDAYDFIIDHVAAADPDIDGDSLAELIDLYFDYHDAFMEEHHMLDWE